MENFKIVVRTKIFKDKALFSQHPKTNTGLEPMKFEFLWINSLPVSPLAVANFRSTQNNCDKNLARVIWATLSCMVDKTFIFI